jgi:hypothetical protein
MLTKIYHYHHNIWQSKQDLEQVDNKVNLVLCFAAKQHLSKPTIYPAIKEKFANATIVMCSTAGEIYHDEVMDDSVVLAAIQFQHTTINAHAVSIKNYENSFDGGQALGKLFKPQGLRYILLLSDGSLVNGSELLKGISSTINKKVLITGGLAGDAANFSSTLVGLNAAPEEGLIAAIGFYGEHLQVMHGSQGGWDIFGLEKTVTKASSNILHEIDGQNALILYKKYLGTEAANLPGSALLFPLSVIVPGTDKPVVRTILSVNENENSMTFAGDIPVGSKVRFMKANFNKITEAAAIAATLTQQNSKASPAFALLISCVGRKLILGNKIADEVKAVEETYGKNTLLAGFYSYGEISPFNEGGSCQLHNQTMTITSFYENKI